MSILKNKSSDYVQVSVVTVSARSAANIDRSRVDRAIAAGKDASEVPPTTAMLKLAIGFKEVISIPLSQQVEEVVASLGLPETTTSKLAGSFHLPSLSAAHKAMQAKKTK